MPLSMVIPIFGIEKKYEVGYSMENSNVNTNKKEDGVSLLTDSFYFLSAGRVFSGKLKEGLDFDTTSLENDWSQMNIEGQFCQTNKGSIIFSQKGKLYIAKVGENNRWEKPKKLKIDGMGKRRVTLKGSSLFYRSWRYPEEDEIVMYNPHLSKDGKRLYYASNYNGTIGNLDIWYSEMKNGKEEEWNKPLNLGEAINTASNENYPFIYEDQLYFSSDKKDSLKGYNIYKQDFSSQESLLLAQPFNSDADDYNMVGDGKYLFLVSTRDGNPDIYYPKQIEMEDNSDSLNSDSLAKSIGDLSNSLADKESNMVKEEAKENDLGNGANQSDKIAMPDINTCILYFIFDQDNFISEYKKELDIIMNFINYHKGADFRIIGHTDTRGSVEYNQGLSERRAQKLKNILVNRGVESKRLKTVGRSELELAIPNAKNEKEHQLNRRVVIEKIEN